VGIPRFGISFAPSARQKASRFRRMRLALNDWLYGPPDPLSKVEKVDDNTLAIVKKS
jgi:hypothetical protein